MLIKNPEHGSKSRFNSKYFSHWLGVFAVYPPEHGPAFITDQSEPEPRVAPTEDKISRSQMMLLLGGMANQTLGRKTFMTGSPNADYELRWYTASLIGALHAIEAEHTAEGAQPDVQVSYNDLRVRADAITEFEAVPDGGLPVAADMARFAAEQYAMLYEQACRP